VDVMGETLVRSTIGELAAGDAVNLERCVPAGGGLTGTWCRATWTALARCWNASPWETGNGSGSAYPEPGALHRRKGFHCH
jgi:hypothetical protein